MNTNPQIDASHINTDNNRSSDIIPQMQATRENAENQSIMTTLSNLPTNIGIKLSDNILPTQTTATESRGVINRNYSDMLSRKITGYQIIDNNFLLENGIISTPQLKKDIITTIIHPQYLKDLKTNYTSRDNWNLANNTFMWTSKVTMGIATILAFVAMYDKERSMLWSFLSGGMNCISGVLTMFEIGASREVKKQIEGTSQILKHIGITEINSSNDKMQDKNKDKLSNTEDIV